MELVNHRILKNGAVEIGHRCFYYPSASSPGELVDEIKTKRGQEQLLRRLWKYSRVFMTYKIPNGVRIDKSDVLAIFPTPKRLLKYFGRT